MRYLGSGWKDGRYAIRIPVERTDLYFLTHLKIGNGCVNDFSRTLSALVWESKILPSAVTVFSGGTEGVLCPHVTFIVQEKFKTGLVACVGRTRCLEPYEIGTEGHA